MLQFLLEHSLIYSLIILSAVVLVKIFLSIFFIKEPMHLFRFFCVQLAKKVNKRSNKKYQQKVAGFLSCIITLAPLFIILWLFESFIEVDWLWQMFLLYFALGSFGLTRAAIKTAKALVANNNFDAKSFIKPYTLRETDKLSSLGITKTTIEMHLLQTIQQCFCVGFYFLLAGPYAALIFRLLLEMHYSWNIKQQKYKCFGVFVNQLVHLLQWFPNRIFVFLLLIGTIGQNFVLFWQLTKKYFFTFNNAIAVYTLALATAKKLGGVAMYNGDKLRRVSFNDNALEPEPSDIIHAVKRVNQILYFSFLSVLFTAVLLLIFTLKG